jgi:hypothetical protein
MSLWVLLFVVGLISFLFGFWRMLGGRRPGESVFGVVQRNMNVSFGGSVTQTNINSGARPNASGKDQADRSGLLIAVIGLVAAVISLVAAIIDALK